MPFLQLYYTSCEQGLSGYPGYQFNAATPGVAPEVMRQIEVLTAYEPPRSLGYDPTAAEIEASPVNLCFVPGPATILAQVVFVGADFSQRSGNYFAHALVATAPDLDLGDLLPIELWRAPVWQRQPSDSLELPERTGPLPRGEIDRSGVQAFLSTRRATMPEDPLPPLLSAAARSITEEAQYVVLVEETSDETAHWIAALSYLLPPQLARRMSFATYHHQPSYAQLDVVGTVSDADVDVSDEALTHSCVFDLAGHRSSDVPVHPLAELLVRHVGVADAGALWERATRLARGVEATLDDWYPMAVAAAAAQHRPLAEVDLDVAIEWLAAECGRLGPEVTTELGAVLLEHPSATDVHVRRLLDAAVDVGSGLREAAEVRLVDAYLDRLQQEGSSAGEDEPPSLTSAASREHARGRIAQALDAADPDVWAMLLAWSIRSGLPIDAAVVERGGERLLGPRLVKAGPSDTARWLLQSSPELRMGVVRYLADRAEAAPDHLLAALESGLGALLNENDAAENAGLRELLLVAAVRRQALGPTDALCQILNSGDLEPVERLPRLLRWLWPHRTWSVWEAHELLMAIPAARLQGDPVIQWLAATLTRPLQSHADIQAYADLCQAVQESPVAELLPERAANHVRDAARIRELIAPARRGPGWVDAGAVEQLTDLLATAATPIDQLAADALPRLLVRTGASVAIDVLPRCGNEVARRYVELARQELQRSTADAWDRAALAAQVFMVAMTLRSRQHPYGDYIDRDVLRDVLPAWEPQDVELLLRRLGETDAKWANEFQRWHAGRRHVSNRAGAGRGLPNWLGRRPRRRPHI